MLIRSVISTVLGLALTPCASANWLEYTETNRLRAELGAAAPTGSGVSVVQSEAPTANGEYYPQAGGPDAFAGVDSGTNRDYTGITFFPESGAQTYSSHANNVARRFFEKEGSIAPGISEVVLYTANDYLNATPSIAGLPGRVHNSSWIGDASQGVLDDADRAVLRDGFVHCAGLNNLETTTLPPLYAHAYNLITVGRMDGRHSRGVTSAIYTGGGRMKPDIVGGADATSYTTPVVSGAAALLLETIDNDTSLAAADDPNVIRAILLAGATKGFNAAWKRVDQSKPYDSVYGAGLVNVYRSYHILKGGTQSPSETVPANLKGWAASSSLNRQRFLLRIPSGLVAEELSVALSWFRLLDDNANANDAARAAVSLILYRVGSDGSLLEVDKSVSAVDNVEHVFRRNLKAGDYIIEVPQLTFSSSGPGRSTTLGCDYSLAWNVELGDGPNLVTPSKGVVQFSGLDPAASYDVRRSTSLVSSEWQTVGTLPAAARFSATFTDPDPPADRAFYRLEWSDPVTPAVN